MCALMRLLVLTLFVSWSGIASATATITGVGDLPGGAYESFVNGVSDDGGVVFGNSNVAAPKSQAFRWTEEFGIEGIGGDPEGTSAVGASSYGQYIAVTSLTDLREWFIYTAPLGLERITHGEVKGISADASVAASNDTRGALRWTAATGSVVLDAFGLDLSATANGISADGTTIVGASWGGGGPDLRAVRWDAAGVPHDLGDLPGGDEYASAAAASTDGSVVVGLSSGPDGVEAFRWTAAAGMQGLGFLPGGSAGGSSAHAISPDGVVALGQCYSPINGNVPCIWDAHHGMRELAEVLASEHGLDLTGWSLFNVTGISSDRRTIVGTGVRNIAEPPSIQVAYEGYVVRLATPLPEPRASSLGGVVMMLFGALRRRPNACARAPRRRVREHGQGSPGKRAAQRGS